MLGFKDADLYDFAIKKFRLKSPIRSLTDLGNQQLARICRLLIHEERKREQHRAKPGKQIAP
jgi:hypothetical protein